MRPFVLVLVLLDDPLVSSMISAREAPRVRPSVRSPQQPHAAARPVELTVVVPAFNERENVDPLVERLEAALGDLAWEVIYVDDDSPDGTSAKIREVSQSNPRVRCVQRI